MTARSGVSEPLTLLAVAVAPSARLEPGGLAVARRVTPPIGAGTGLGLAFQKSPLEMVKVLTPVLPPETTPTSPFPSRAVSGMVLETAPR
ncbi:hypothetical protein [Streptacidiphilus jeojiense]|uniref:hypothetical protein n=1 Tax=Streptacidiphilus jeojiense TaxID=436229 RepID=UPI0004C28F73|nr:hypothetical protein [Streptacidiphilus jeojiense]